MSKVREKIKLTSYDELLKVDSSDGAIEVEISRLKEFENHPFKVIENEQMDELVSSIKERGILTPILVRERDNGEYEIISGHRRKHAAKLAGLDTVPILITNMSDDDAIVVMVDSNIQREEILPSEKAFAFKMKRDAISHQGKNGNLSRDVVGKESGVGGRQVSRYIKLTNLIPELLDLVDEKKITITLAVEIADLSESEQQYVFDKFNLGQAISKQTIDLIKNKIEEKIPTSNSKQKTKVTIPENKLYKYFPAEYSQKDMEEVIYTLLEKWKSEKDDI